MTTYRMRALEVARGELGVKEHPAGSNWGPRVKQYLASAGWKRPAPWCMAFVHFCYRQSGLVLSYPNPASVGFFEDWARKHGYIVDNPQRGDIVCYRFDKDNWPDHVGIVYDVTPTSLRAIEGNTAVGNDANGGMVMMRSRSRARCKFARIPGYASDYATTPDDKALDQTIDLLKKTPAYKRGWRRMVELVRRYEAMRRT